MSSNPTILIQIIAKDGATAITKQVDASVKQLANDVKQSGQDIVNSTHKTDEGLRDLVHTSDIFGLRMRDIKHVMLGAFAGIDVAIAAVGDKIDADTKKALDLARSGTEVATAFAFGGPIGGAIAALGVGIGLVISRLQEADKAAQQVRDDISKPFDEARASLDAINKIDPLTNLAKSLTISVELLRKFAEMSDEAKQKVIELNDAEKQLSLQQAEQIRLLQERARAEGVIATAQTKRGYGSQYLTATVQQEMKLLNVQAQENVQAQMAMMQAANLNSAAIERQAGVLAGTTGALVGYTTELEHATNAEQSMFQLGQGSFLAGIKAAGDATMQFNNDINNVSPALAQQNNYLDASQRRYAALDDLLGHRMPISIGASKIAYAEWQKELADTSAADRARQSQQALMNALKGIVEGVLTPTTVDARLARQGDAWDEWRLRLEADMTGTNLAERAWGAQFSATLAQVQQKTGFSLQQIDAKFKDFSLFANKDVMMTPGLIDWGAIVGDTADAVDKIIGKYNLVKAGVDAYLASPEAQFQLPNLAQALGISTAGVDTAQLKQQVSQALTGALGGITGGAEGGATTAVKTTMVFDAKKAITDAGMLKKDIADIPASLKGETVKTIQDLSKSSTFDATLTTIISDLNKIPEELNATVTIVYRSSSPPAAASNEAGTAAGAAETVPTYGLGGYVPKTGLAFLHKDEYVVPPGGLPPPSMRFGGGGVVTTGGGGGVHFHAHADFRLPSESELARDLVEVMRRDPSELLRLYERLVAEWGRMTRAKAANGQV